MATVVALPSTTWQGTPGWIEEVVGAVDAEGESAAEVCAHLMTLDPVPPLVIVASGAGCGLLPAVALAQRTAHRRVVGYLLIDPIPPASTDGWPDAPVHVVTSDPDIAHRMRLRGWSVSDEHPAHAVARLAAEVD